MINKSLLNRGGRGGFTLIEVLVVLGILVVLFALLFVPMTQSVNMATSGRTQVEMQQDLRGAMEQVSRDLSEAIYVYPPELLKVQAASSVYTGEHAYIVNYSTVSFVAPMKDSTGQPKEPLQPSFQATPAGQLPLVTRYAVHTVNTAIRTWPAGGGGGSNNPSTSDKYFMVSAGPGPESTFQLYRQQGYCLYDADLGTYTFGSYYDVDGNGTTTAAEFVIDRPNAENALTPRTGGDVVCSRTFCRDNGQWVKGYVPVNLNVATDPSDDTLDLQPGTPPDTTWTPQVAYLFDGLEFRPERVTDDRTVASADASSYRASRGAWLGQLDNGSKSIFDLVFGVGGQWINSSELRPRIVVRRWDGSDYGTTVMDTDLLDPTQTAPDSATDNLLTLRYDSRSGQVMTSDVVPLPAQTAAYPGVTFGTSSGVGRTNALWPPFTRGGPAPTAQELRPDLVPELPPDPTTNLEPAAPIGYVIDPWRAEAEAGGWSPWGMQDKANARDVRVVPGSVRIWLLWHETGSNQVARRELAECSVQSPDDIGVWQFTATPFDDGKQVEVKFNPSLPPGPDLIFRMLQGRAVGVENPQILLTYRARRNFDPASGKDDQVTVSYSTGSAYNVKLAVSEYSPYTEQTAGAANQVPFKPGAQALLSARVAVRNSGR